jgi:hypothetical protein
MKCCLLPLVLVFISQVSPVSSCSFKRAVILLYVQNFLYPLNASYRIYIIHAVCFNGMKYLRNEEEPKYVLEIIIVIKFTIYPSQEQTTFPIHQTLIRGHTDSHDVMK